MSKHQGENHLRSLWLGGVPTFIDDKILFFFLLLYLMFTGYTVIFVTEVLKNCGTYKEQNILRPKTWFVSNSMDGFKTPSTQHTNY